MHAQLKSRPKARFVWEDPLLLDEQLTEDERMVRDAARAYCQDKLAPRVLEAFRHEKTDAKIFPEMAGMLENPDAAFAKLKELGLGLFGGAVGAPQGQAAPGTGNQQSGPAGSILQGIGDILKNLGNTPGSGQPSTANPSR